MPGMKVLILGVNGFIGHHLSKRILEHTDWQVYGMDLEDARLGPLRDDPRFHFVDGDISIHREWVEYHVKKCDVILPLVAIATPKTYVERPLEVFSLAFEENLRIVRYCVKYQRKLVFPSSSEVYGMCSDEVFDEDESTFVLGPIRKQRWIYSCAKQLLDRVIWAYGKEHGLRFTLFRPFNWIGPRLDSLETAKIGSSRVVTQFIGELIHGEDLRLVDGGRQRRCFTYIDDGIDALMQILENPQGRCDGQILNVGNPENDCSIENLANLLQQIFEKHTLRSRFGSPGQKSRIVSIAADDYYGDGYQDLSVRKPRIQKAMDLLGWKPKVGLEDALWKTLDAFLKEEIDPL